MYRLFNNLIQAELMAPAAVAPSGNAGIVDSSSKIGSSPELSKDDIIDFLGSDDDKKDDIIPLDDKDKKDDKDDKKPEKKADDKEKSEEDEEIEDDEDDELKELEEELEEVDEDKLELTTPTSRREILKKYPKLFKDFPNLEKAYYREQEYTKILPTISDAKDAVDKAQTLDKFEQDLVTGNTETILKAVKENTPKSFNKIVDDYLGALSRVDEKAYLHVTGNIVKHTIVAMVQEGRKTQNEALESAAAILNQFVFGSSTFTPPKKLSSDEKPEVDEKEAKITEREKEFTQQRYKTASKELNTKVNNSFKATIEANIDPKESMSDYVKKTASREALEELETLISKDTRFKVIIDKLWERALKEDFSSESVDKIRGAFISKARTLLPSVIKKARNEALKGMGKRVRDNDDEPHPRKGSKKDDESRQRNDSNDRSKREVPKGMTSLEFLMSDD
jgi:hypothetical protein